MYYYLNNLFNLFGNLVYSFNFLLNNRHFFNESIDRNWYFDWNNCMFFNLEDFLNFIYLRAYLLHLYLFRHFNFNLNYLLYFLFNNFNCLDYFFNWDYLLNNSLNNSILSMVDVFNDFDLYDLFLDYWDIN